MAPEHFHYQWPKLPGGQLPQRTPPLLDRSVGFFVGLLLAVIVGGSFYGWTSNIVKLAGSSFDPLGGVVVIRAIGIPVVPVGIVMGYVP